MHLSHKKALFLIMAKNAKFEDFRQIEYLQKQLQKIVHYKMSDEKKKIW